MKMILLHVYPSYTEQSAYKASRYCKKNMSFSNRPFSVCNLNKLPFHFFFLSNSFFFFSVFLSPRRIVSDNYCISCKIQGIWDGSLKNNMTRKD